jgi:hypothetical protein
MKNAVGKTANVRVALAQALNALVALKLVRIKRLRAVS